MRQSVPRELLVLGAGGFARETAAIVRAINASEASWRPLGFLDDNRALHGVVIAGLPVLGPIDAVHDYPDARVVICTGRPDNYVSRRLIAERLDLDAERYATIIHPSAVVDESCRVGEGSVLSAHVDLTADVVVGRHVAIMPQVVLTHDVRVDDWATFACGVLVGGGCHIRAGAYLGSGSCVRERLTIGSWSMIGMGSLVTRDVPDERLWCGAPARDMSRAPLPPHTPWLSDPRSAAEAANREERLGSVVSLPGSGRRDRARRSAEIR